MSTAVATYAAVPPHGFRSLADPLHSVAGMSYTPEQRLLAARDCIHSARGELVDVLSPDGQGGWTVRRKAFEGARDRAAFRLQLAAHHTRRYIEANA